MPINSIGISLNGSEADIGETKYYLPVGFKQRLILVENLKPVTWNLKPVPPPTLQLRTDKQHRHFVGQVKNKLPPSLKLWQNTRNPKPSTSHPAPRTQHLAPSTSHPATCLSAVSLAENPKPKTRNPKPETSHPAPLRFAGFRFICIIIKCSTYHLTPVTFNLLPPRHNFNLQNYSRVIFF